MSPCTIHTAAESELATAAADYDRRRSGLALEFLTEFDHALQRVRENPLLYAAEDEAGNRFCPLYRFPYTLVYRIIGDAVWINTVMHQHRRPGYWSRRKPE